MIFNCITWTKHMKNRGMVVHRLELKQDQQSRRSIDGRWLCDGTVVGNGDRVPVFVVVVPRLGIVSVNIDVPHASLCQL